MIKTMNYSALRCAAEAPMELPKVDLNINVKKVELIDVKLPDLEKKPRFSFPLRDRFIMEKDTFKLTATIDTDTLPVPTVSITITSTRTHS